MKADHPLARDPASDVIVVGLRSPLELAKEASQSQCFEGRRFLFDRERDVEQSISSRIAQRRKAFSETARTGKQIDNLGRNAAAIDGTNENLPFAMREVIGEVLSPYLIAEVRRIERVLKACRDGSS